jgi:hypothetical protein
MFADWRKRSNTALFKKYSTCHTIIAFLANCTVSISNDTGTNFPVKNLTFELNLFLISI